MMTSEIAAEILVFVTSGRLPVREARTAGEDPHRDG
jgi:hypothetical protein